MHLRTLILASLALALAAPLLGAVQAESAPRQRPAQRVQAGTPPKDCTPYNSRYGFYGNIWCTPAEQRRWDRWDAARFRSR